MAETLNSMRDALLAEMYKTAMRDFVDKERFHILKEACECFTTAMNNGIDSAAANNGNETAPTVSTYGSPRRMRTINEVVAYYKAMDANTMITSNFLRRHIVSGDIQHVMAGNKYLVALEDVDAFLTGNGRKPLNPKPEPGYGTIRPI